MTAELDIAADRNLGIETIGKETIFKMMHRSIRHLHIFPNRFQLDVIQEDPALFDAILREIEKLRETLQDCIEVTEKRTPFHIRQTTVEINRISLQEKHITVLDTDLGTDDACALLLMKGLPVKPDYIVASFGNTSLDGACRNAVLLKKYLGLSAVVVRGQERSDNSLISVAEKNTFHGEDGLANCVEEMQQKLELTQQETEAILSFTKFEQAISQADSVTYITIGTLANLAKLIKNEAFRRKLRGAYVMGGGIREFNCSHETEFNFSKDPESVKALLSSGLNITLFPLDVTNHQRITAEQINQLEKIGTYPEYIRFLRHNLQANATYNGIPAAVLHDTIPVLYLAHPEWFRLEEMRIVSDEYGHIAVSGKGEAIHVCTAMVENRLFEVIRGQFFQ